MPVKKGEETDIDIQTPQGIVPVRIRMIVSSNIKWVGWPRGVWTAQLLFVEFMDGSRYVYNGVTRQRAVAAAYADSTGKYLNERIKPNREALKLR